MKKSIFSLLVFFSILFLSHSVHSQGKNFRLLKQINFFQPYTTGELWGYSANGREYAIVGGYNGTHFVDITDSTNIHSVGFVAGINRLLFRVMKVYSHYAYIGTMADTSGIQIVDLQYLPDSVRFVKKYIPPGHTFTHTIQQSGPYLYLMGGNPSFTDGVAVLDLSVNPEQPVLRGKWSNSYVHDCRVVNDTLWAPNLATGKVTVINAVNKDNLTTITDWVNGPNPLPHNCSLTADRKYIFVTDETFTPPGRLKIWNVQDLSNITLERTWIPSEVFKNCGVHNVELYGNVLASVYYGAGVKLFDVSNPVNPIELGWYDTCPQHNESIAFDGGCGVYMFPSGKIIASDFNNGFFVLRYAPPQNAPPKAEFMTDKNIVYSINDSVQFIDCSSNNPTDYKWTITGNQNFSYTSQNPKMKFTYPGYYSIKLRVSNAYGSDSVIKENFRISGTIFNGFLFYGNAAYNVVTNKFDTSKVKFSWQPASPPGFNTTYQFKIKKLGGVDEFSLLTDNNGSDTSITLRKSKLDTLIQQLGLSGDSIVTICKATAYSFSDSLQSGNTLRITFKSTSVGIQNISSQIPDKYRLENNYPNPFNPSTNIKFQLPEKSFASIIIYDVLGREVERILNEELQAGYYNFQFSGENLNSGIYFYKIVTDKFSETKRMVLLK